MNCARCNGCVVPEQTLNPHATTERFEVVRGLNCGNSEDAMIRPIGITICAVCRQVADFPLPAAPLIAGSIP